MFDIIRQTSSRANNPSKQNHNGVLTDCLTVDEKVLELAAGG